MKRIVVILTILLTFSAFSVMTHADASLVENDEGIVTQSTPEQEVNDLAQSPTAAATQPLSSPDGATTNEPLCAVQEESDITNGESDTPDGPQDAPSSGVMADAADAEKNADTEGDEDASLNETDTLFSMLYELVLRYATEILSALAAIASCLLALGYKKGLIPFVQQGLGVISGTVKSLGEKAESANLAVCEQSEATRLSAERIEQAVQTMSDSILAVSERLCRLEEASAERAGIREALIGEIEMLSEIFLASSLPEYRKEKVGATVAKLKEQLTHTKEA